MPPSRNEAFDTRRGLAAVALAVLAIGLAASSILERLDLAVLDRQWRILRAAFPSPSPVDIVIVGVDEATVAAIPDPPGLWHEHLARVLAKIAAAQPRAIGIDLPLPDRSYESVKPGLDRPLVLGLLAARESAPLVASLSIDPQTRGVRRIHPPFLAVLQEERLGIGLLARDADGASRRFSIALPTEDGAFPTTAGRLCRALSRNCSDGLIDFARGGAFKVVPFQDVMAAKDLSTLQSHFRDRIVLIGETAVHRGRIPVPVNLAGWEDRPSDSPATVVHAAALRTALDGAPEEASRPLAVLVASLPVLLVLLPSRRWRAVLAASFVPAGGALGLWALKQGLVVPLGAAFTIAALIVLAAAGCELNDRYALQRR